jgi:hypothetical protein
MPGLANRHTFQQVFESAAVIEIGMGQDEAGEVRLWELGDEFIDDGDVLVPLLVGHGLVIDVDLDDFAFTGRRWWWCRAHPTGQKMKDGPATFANIYSPLVQHLESRSHLVEHYPLPDGTKTQRRPPIEKTRISAGGAPGGTRTPTSLRTTDFESAASTVPPLGLREGGAS